MGGLVDTRKLHEKVVKKNGKWQAITPSEFQQLSEMTSSMIRSSKIGGQILRLQKVLVLVGAN